MERRKDQKQSFLLLIFISLSYKAYTAFFNGISHPEVAGILQPSFLFFPLPVLATFWTPELFTFSPLDFLCFFFSSLCSRDLAIRQHSMAYLTSGKQVLYLNELLRTSYLLSEHYVKSNGKCSTILCSSMKTM